MAAVCLVDCGQGWGGARGVEGRGGRVDADEAW